MDDHEPQMPIPWLRLILTFVLSTVLLVSLCLAILQPSKMQLIRSDSRSPAAYPCSMTAESLVGSLSGPASFTE